MRNKEPVLAAKSFAPGRFDGERVAMSFKVEGGLHYLRGNDKPYFSLTYTAHRKGFPNQCYSGGAGHDTILKYFPQFADLAALHLSDIDGVPTHAIANGWYWMAGALGGGGERYHGGNQMMSFPVTPPAGRPWANSEYRNPTADETLAIFAKHARIDIYAATILRDNIRSVLDTNGRERAKEVLAGYLEEKKPDWKAEAEACIAKYNLQVYGDKWEKVA